MIEITNNLFIGDQNDFEFNVKGKDNWSVVHACKEPYHRALLGYSGRGAPKNHSEYLFAKRKNLLFLNLIDTDSPAYISKAIIDVALKFIDEALFRNRKCLVHCNLGESRSPSIGFLYLAKNHLLSKDYYIAENEFRDLYPAYNPKNGIRLFVKNNWNEYVN